MKSLSDSLFYELTGFVKGASEKLGFFEKQAAEMEQSRKRFRPAIQKVAEKLYDADYLMTSGEVEEFTKRASEDPNYLLNWVDRLCNAADVTLIGKTASATYGRENSEDRLGYHDPVYERTFGGSL